MTYMPIIMLLAGSLSFLISGLCLWNGILIFRDRGAAGWVALCGAILQPVFMLGGYSFSYLRNIFWGYSDTERQIYVMQGLFLAGSFSLAVFLVGALMHLLRSKSQAARIGELETIIQDLQRSNDPTGSRN